MSTQSFDKSFVVSNKDDIQKFKTKLNENHKVIVVKSRDVESDSKRGVELLKNFW